MTKPELWSILTAAQENLAITRFQREVEAKTNRLFGDYEALHGRSVEALINSDDIVNAQFFPEARLNYAENCLRRTGEGPAILFRSETEETHAISWDQLATEVSMAP